MNFNKVICRSQQIRVSEGNKLSTSVVVPVPTRGESHIEASRPFSSQAVMGDLTIAAPLVDTRLAAGPSAENSIEDRKTSVVRHFDDESASAQEWEDDDGYIIPPPFWTEKVDGQGPNPESQEVAAATWRNADAMLHSGVAVHVPKRGVKEIDNSVLVRTEAKSHGLSCDWEELPSLEDNSEYVHENVRRYRRPVRSSRKADVFLRLSRDIGDNFYWGTYITTQAGNRLWTWKLFQMPGCEVRDLQEKESRHIRKCGTRVAIKPLGVDPAVLAAAETIYPEAGRIRLRHALALPEAPKTMSELPEMLPVLDYCVRTVSGKLPCYHYYKDKLQLVMEGIEPNPGPAPVTWEEFSARSADEEQKLVDAFERAGVKDKEALRELRSYLSGARFLRATVAVIPGGLNPDLIAGHYKLLESLYDDGAILRTELDAMRFMVRNAQGSYPYGDDVLQVSDYEDVDVAFWYILADLAAADIPMAGSIFPSTLGSGTSIFIGDDVKTKLLGEEPLSDPRVAPQSGERVAVLDPVQNTRGEEQAVFNQDTRLDDDADAMKSATRKRDLRRKAWRRSIAVPVGLLDLCRYVLCDEQSSPFRLYGIYLGLVETYKKTGQWVIDVDQLEKAMKEQELRAAKIADRGLAITFEVDESLFPMYFTAANKEDLALLKYYGQDENDVVVSDVHDTLVARERVFELCARNTDSHLVLSVRSMVSEEVLNFEYPLNWCKLASKKLMGCAPSLNACEIMCRSLITAADHTQAPSEFASHQGLRIKAFAAAMYGLAHAMPVKTLSEREVLSRIAEFRPLAEGTYHEAYTTGASELTDKYRDLARPVFRVGDHTIDNSFIIIRDPANVKLNPSARLAREGPECLLPAYARPDPNSLWEQLNGIVKRLSVGRIPLDEKWKETLERKVWPEVKAYVEGRSSDFHFQTPDQILEECKKHAREKGFKGIEYEQYLGGASRFLRGANGEPNLLDEAWRTEYGCFTKSENYALSGKKPTRSIQCPDMFVRGYQHAMLANAQHNLFQVVFSHLTIKHLDEAGKLEKIRQTFRTVERVVCTDLTAMEKNVSSFMMTFEREIFKACSPKWAQPAIEVAWDELMNTSRSISHKMFDLFVDPMRASGEDHTSAGNFICNLMWICAWTGDAAGILNGTRPCLVEGDDGQVSGDGLELPSPKEIAGLGIRIKLEEEVMDSSFVSKMIKNDRPVCDALSIAQNFSVIRDPDLASNHGDLQKQYAMALSYYYLYGAYPIIGPYFRGYLLRHHDEVMGSTRGMQAVRNAFASKYVGWVDPDTIEAMWQDVLRGVDREFPTIETTEADLAETAGVSVELLQQIYSGKARDFASTLPTGKEHRYESVKGAVRKACQIHNESPVVVCDDRSWLETWTWGWFTEAAEDMGTGLPGAKPVRIERGTMAKRLRSHTFVRKIDYHVRWSRIIVALLVVALAGMTLVIPRNGTIRDASVPKPQEMGYRYGYAGRIPHGRPAVRVFPRSWWSDTDEVFCRRDELIAVGSVKKIYSASWALVPVSGVRATFDVPLRTDSSEPRPIAPWHGHIDMPQPELVIRQWPRLPLLVEFPPQETVVAPAEVPMRQEVVSVFCATYETLVFQPPRHFTLKAGQCVLVRVDRQKWTFDLTSPAEVPYA